MVNIFKQFTFISLKQLEDRKLSQCTSNTSRTGLTAAIERVFSVPLVSSELDSGQAIFHGAKHDQIDSHVDDTENQNNTSRKRSAEIKSKDRQEPFSKSKPKKSRQALRTITVVNEERKEEECSTFPDLKSSVIDCDFSLSV
jgi:hypothetical protein